MNIRLEQVRRPSQYASPFDVDSRGFNRVWWNISPGPYRDSSNDWYILAQAHDEIARVEVNHSRLIYSKDYQSWPQDQFVAEITFIEVRADLKHEGFGTRLIEGLARRYPNRRLAAHPKNSEGFWEKLGWHRYENMRSEGHEPSLYAEPVKAPHSG